MKRYFSLLLLLLLSLTVCKSSLCQGGNTLTITFPGAPTGTCAYFMLAVRADTGALYNCNAGSWTAAGGGTGNVVGPGSSTAGDVASFSDTGGKILQDVGPAAASLVTASSPGAGVAHFAGSTQAVTSSAVTAADATGNTSGSGNFCLTTSCAMTTPNLGTPSAIVLTNATGFPATIVQTNQANTYSTGLQQFASATMGLPSSAAYAPTTAALFGYDSTNNRAVLGNGTNTSFIPWFTAAPTTNVVKKASGTLGLQIDSSITDDGTTVTTTDTSGYKGPIFVSNGTTSGFIDFPQGTTSSAVAPCNVATSICEQAPTAVTSYLVNKPGSASSGIEMNVNASNVITQSWSGDANHIVSQTGKTALISTATLCAATAGTACGQVGQYRISYNFWGSGTACSSVTAGSVGLNFTWTDEGGNAHTTVSAPMYDQKTAATGILFNFNTALTTESAGGSLVVSTNGTIIQYATTYTACTTGTGTYNLRMTVEQIQ